MKVLKMYEISIEISTVQKNMERFGGSFAKNLAVALMYADIENAAKIKATWPEMWETYLNWDK